MTTAELENAGGHEKFLRILPAVYEKNGEGVVSRRTRTFVRGGPLEGMRQPGTPATGTRADIEASPRRAGRASQKPCIELTET
jgi:hypothetical protein